MKLKNLLFILAGIFLFACSNDDQPNAGSQSGQQQIVFEISAKAGMQVTRAESPIYSQEATQSVANVSIYAFKETAVGSGTFLYEKTFDAGWTAGQSSVVHTVASESDELPVGTYRFLAVGLPATHKYTITTPQVSTTDFADMVAEIASVGQEYEIFASTGSGQVTAAGARITMEMTRKVAGILAYFTNVPTTQNGQPVRYLRLTASKANKQVNLTTGVGAAPAEGTYNIVDIDFTGRNSTQGIYEGNAIDGVTKLPNSQLYGAYLIPATDVVFTLGLYSETNAPLKTWTVSNSGVTDINLTANHFYSIGQKKSTTDITGGESGGEADADQAFDLLTDQAIQITIDPEWAEVHPLTIVPTP